MQPGEKDLERKCREIAGGKNAASLFPNVAALDLTTAGEGPSLQLRFAKKEGIPIQVVPEGNRGRFPVAIRRVNELDFYNLGLTGLAEKVGLQNQKHLQLFSTLGFKNLKIFSR